MGLRNAIERATHFVFTCQECHAEIRDGSQFGIVGTMSRKIRQVNIARADIQFKMLGPFLCATCLRRRVCNPK